MGRVEEFLQKADEAERDAAQMSRDDDRRAMLEIARTWRAMAEEQEPEPPRG